MSNYYSYTLDGIPFSDDIIGIDSLSRSIIREWNGSGIENILRVKSDTTLTFTGKAFSYLCNKGIDYCAETEVNIYINNNYLFYSGTIYEYMITYNLTKRTAETAIKDNNWSSVLRNRSATEIYLRSTKTINCEDIDRPEIKFVEFVDINGNPLSERRYGFNVLEVLDYMAKFLTDNQAQVQSTYLTNHQYGIFTGAVIGENVDQALLPFTDRWPTLSFDTLFSELRKKLNLYINVDYTTSPITLQIEPEITFFDSTNVYSLPINYDIKKTTDADKLVSRINVGSDDTDIQDEIYRSFPNRRFFNWNEIAYNNCSCESDKNNELDLVSGFIISSDVIHETLLTGGKTGEDIFLVRCLFSGTIGIAGATLDNATGKYYYNEDLRNPNVIDRWRTYASTCIYSSRDSDLLFRSKCDPLPTPLPPFWPECQGRYAPGNAPRITNGSIFYIDPLTSSNPNSFDSEDGWIFRPGGYVYDLLPNYSGYVIQIPTYYIFFARAVYGMDANASIQQSNVKFSIVVYSDSTLTTEIYRKDVNESYFNQSSISDVFECTTDFIFLSFGNTVVVEVVNEHISPVNIPITSEAWTGDEFMIDNDLLACFDVPTDAAKYPIKYEFTQPICFEDFDYLVENKGKSISIGSAECFISEITQDIKGDTKFILLSNQNICCDA